MGANSPIDLFASFFGWYANNIIFGILSDTGILLIPFIMIVAKAFHKAAISAAKGARGRASFQMAKIELLIATLVFMFAVVPVTPVNIQNAHVARVNMECSDGADAPIGMETSGGNTGTTYDNSFTQLGGKGAKVPLYWGLVTNLFSSVTAAAVAGLPCSTDFRAFQTKLADQKIDDTGLRQETRDFHNECFSRAMYKFMSEPPTGVTQDEVAWLGSDFFMNTPGYFDSMQPINQRKDYSYQSARDGELDPAKGGRPYCKDWYNNLRGKLKGAIEPDLLTKVRSSGLASFFSASMTAAEKEEKLIRSVVEASTGGGFMNTRNGNNINRVASIYDFGSNMSGLDDHLASKFGGMGVEWDQMSHYPKIAMLRMALPIVQALLYMAVIVVLPLALMFSSYSVGTVFTFTVGLFAIKFLTFLWGMAFWLDNNMFEALSTGNVEEAWAHLSASPGRDSWLGDTPQEDIMQMVTSILYVGLPMAFAMAMGWAGLNVGNLINQITSSMTNDVKNSGATVVDGIKGAVVQTATKAIAPSKRK